MLMQHCIKSGLMQGCILTRIVECGLNTLPFPTHCCFSLLLQVRQCIPLCQTLRFHVPQLAGSSTKRFAALGKLLVRVLPSLMISTGLALTAKLCWSLCRLTQHVAKRRMVRPVMRMQRLWVKNKTAEPHKTFTALLHYSLLGVESVGSVSLCSRAAATG